MKHIIKYQDMSIQQVDDTELADALNKRGDIYSLTITHPDRKLVIKAENGLLKIQTL